MLAPLATGSKVKAAVKQLYRDASDSDREAPEQLDPEEATDQVDEEYRPLMAGESGSEHETDALRLGETAERREVRKLEVWISYGIYFILGACILLPWSSAIVASSYFRSRLSGSSLAESVSLWVAQTFTLGNLFFLAAANGTQQGANLARRVMWSIGLMMLVLGLGMASTLFNEIAPSLFFSVLIFCIVLLSASASFLQNAVVALSSRFGPLYLQGILSGQGAVGLSTSVLQFFSALSAQKAAQSLSFVVDAVPKAIRESAFYFFVTITAFSAFALLAQAVLVRLPLYRLVIRGAEVQDPGASKKAGKHINVWAVERKVRTLGFSIFYIFFVTLALFPSITSSILSVHSSASSAWWTDPMLFVPIHFIVFNAGDWFGRALPQWEKLVWRSRRGLVVASLARTVFIPLFLLCNVRFGSTDPDKVPFFNSDAIFMFFLILFAVSNGYISTLIMLAVVVDPSLEEDEVDIGATCLAFYLTSGLAMGSFVSFGVKGAVCGCNPFA